MQVGGKTSRPHGKRRVTPPDVLSEAERLPGFAGIGDGHYVMSSSAQRFDDRERKVLVSEEARQERLRAFVVADLSVDLVPVSSSERTLYRAQ